MAKPRIFVSSTCFDLGVIRSELRPFIVNMGYEPIMSDYADILYDPRSHTHESCIREVPSCDVLLLVLGQRFGGVATPSALEGFDFEALAKGSSSSGVLSDRTNLSITQLEVLKAVEHAIPIYAFVDEKVYHDHLVYEKNKHNATIIDQIKFPSIQKDETAKYIFEFINYLTHRVQNNSITPFARLDDIKSHLVSQWSLLFQRLLSENRTRSLELKRYQDFSERLDDLKAVVLASMSEKNLRSIAKGAIQFRHLISFVSALDMPDHQAALLSEMSWEELLLEAKIVDVQIPETTNNPFLRSRVYLVMADDTFYQCRFPGRHYENLRADWALFVRSDLDTRTAIVNALLDDPDVARSKDVFLMGETLTEYMSEKVAGTESNTKIVWTTSPAVEVR
ncbi:protein of unknown function [Pseudomonas marginalis]|uniref:DUF4062 domain-containing protein n=1 Tax=Pseudomonas marginalis TaxID=298 RepID=UPI000894D63B|nr:DUF4062 domain-containing protein [Pseudomonas marginalis]SEC74658.1 protein of unknown function [Pseudomonas marginalis]